jgi:hypothetical protein
MLLSFETVFSALQKDSTAGNNETDAVLEIWDGMIHGWHAFHPMLDEGKKCIECVGEFLREKWAAVE